MSLRLGFLVSHPIQYYAPIFRALAERCDLQVFFAHRQTGEGQAKSGFGVAFEWDVDLLAGYQSTFLTNVARQPSTDRFNGCDTPGIAEEIARGRFDAFVVPGWGLRCYLQAVRACRRARVPVMVRGDLQLPGQRSAAVRLAKALLYRRMMRRFDGYLYVGQRSREYFEHYGAPESRLFFAPHCIDNQAFAHKRPARRAANGRRRLLFAGKLIERKRPLDLVRAAALLQGRGAKVEVAFAGSGELEAELKRATEAAGLPAVFHGFVNQSALPATYAAADLLVPAVGRPRDLGAGRQRRHGLRPAGGGVGRGGLRSRPDRGGGHGRGLSARRHRGPGGRAWSARSPSIPRAAARRSGRDSPSIRPAARHKVSWTLPPHLRLPGNGL